MEKNNEKVREEKEEIDFFFFISFFLFSYFTFFLKAVQVKRKYSSGAEFVLWSFKRGAGGETNPVSRKPASLK